MGALAQSADFIGAPGILLGATVSNQYSSNVKKDLKNLMKQRDLKNLMKQINRTMTRYSCLLLQYSQFVQCLCDAVQRYQKYQRKKRRGTTSKYWVGGRKMINFLAK